MTEPTSPASAQPNQPAGALSIAQAAAEMASRRAAASAATTAPVAPSPTADETDQSEAAPVEVETADSTAGDGEQPADLEAEGADDLEAAGDDPDGDYIELPDGQKIPVEEAVKAHQNFKALQARVTRKEQALAEERRALEQERLKVKEELGGTLEQTKAQAEQLAQIREEYAHKLQLISKSIGDDDGRWANVDWQKLEDEDPIQAGRLWREFQRHNERKAAAQRELEGVQKQQQQEFEQRLAEARAKARAFVAEKYPAVLDPSQPLGNAMFQAAREYGFSEHEISIGALDPRNFALWHDATLYRQMMAQKSAATAKPTAPKPDATGTIRVVKARAARPNPIPAPKAALGRAQAAYNANPSRENALALMQAQRSS